MVDTEKSELVYVYGFVPTNEIMDQLPSSLTGLDGGESGVWSFNDITAITCRVSENHFSTEALERNVHDLKWLQEKALLHHESVSRLQANFTVVPVKFCTIFRSEEGLEEVIKENYEKILSLFSIFYRKEEWNIKVYFDEEKLKTHVIDHNDRVQSHRQALTALSPGKQFFARKKLDQLIEQELEKEKIKRSEQIHEQLTSLCEISKVKRNWDQKSSQDKGQKMWNGIFLVDTEQLDAFTNQIRNLRNIFDRDGLVIESSGPWAPYHFADLN